MFDRYSLPGNNLFNNPFTPGNTYDPDNIFNRPTIDPTQVEPQALPQPPAPVNTRPSILDQYNAITSNRPQRDALAALVAAPPQREDYKPGKLSRLGAILSGASAGFRDPEAGVRVAQSIIDRPFNQAEDTYQQKLRNVSALAGMEGEDVRTKLEGLNVGRQEEKDTRDFNLRQQEFNSRMEELKDKDWEKIKDDTSGRVGWTNRKNGQTIYGPVIGETLAEGTKREAGIAKALRDSVEKVAGIQAEASKYGADKRAASAAANLRARAQLLKPGDINIKASNDLAALSDIYDLSVTDMEKYIDKDEATGRLFVNDDRVGKAFRNDSTTDLEIKAAMRQVLSRAYSGAKDENSTKDVKPAPPDAATGKSIGGWVIK